jgi:hypothetical protein
VTVYGETTELPPARSLPAELPGDNHPQPRNSVIAMPSCCPCRDGYFSPNIQLLRRRNPSVRSSWGQIHTMGRLSQQHAVLNHPAFASMVTTLPPDSKKSSRGCMHYPDG